MNLLFYNLSIWFYYLGISIFSLFNSKAKKWRQGRKEIFQNLEHAFSYQGNQKLAWFHVASLGEFEQARPVIEGFRIKFPDYQILLTFFSPSGYEVRKNYEYSDFTFYLPLDTKANAKRFLEITKPNLVFWVKYEFWYHYLQQIQKQQIPVILFSAIFRPDHWFFKKRGKWFLTIFKGFEHIFVQNAESQKLLHQKNIDHVSIVGDTRFDRVLNILENKKDFPLVEKFKNKTTTLIVGSSWREDLQIIIPFFNQFSEKLKLIIAPHELRENTYEWIEKNCSKKIIRYSQANKDSISNFDVLIIDNIGMLSSLYQYGDFAFIGGGFKNGLHNILEPAVFGMPIFFGNKKYKKFNEALLLIDAGGAFPVQRQDDFSYTFLHLFLETKKHQEISKKVADFVQENRGATKKILESVSNLKS